MTILGAMIGRRIVVFPSEAHAECGEQTYRCAPTQIQADLECLRPDVDSRE